MRNFAAYAICILFLWWISPYVLSVLFRSCDLNLLLELSFGITPVKPGFQSQLIQKSFIKPPRSQFGIRKLQDDIFFPGKFRIKSPDQSGFSASGIRCYHSKYLPVCCIAEPAQCFPESIRLVKLFRQYITDKGSMFHSQKASYIAIRYLLVWSEWDCIHHPAGRFRIFPSNASRKREVVGICPCITTGSVGSASQNSTILIGCAENDSYSG